MRPPQCTLTAAAVQQLFAHWLAPVLGPWPGVRRCTAPVVCAVLAYAAHRLSFRELWMAAVGQRQTRHAVEDSRRPQAARRAALTRS